MGNLWHRNGYCEIPVEQQDIDRALERESSHCAVAMAIARVVEGATHIAVDVQTIRFTRRGLRYIFLTPHLARDCIVNFDQGERDKLVPFTLRMRPAQIAQAGKKRKH